MPINQDNRLSLLVGFFVFFISSFNYWFWSAVGLGFCAFIFMVFLSRLGKTIPILELMLLMSALQWVFGAHQSYVFDFKHFKYFMYVDRETYMSTIIPGLLAFALGIYVKYPQYNFDKVNLSLEKLVQAQPKMPLYLIIIGFLTSLVSNYLPGTLGFIFFLLGNFKFIGVVLWLFMPGSNKKWWITGLILFLTLLSSIQAGMFHDLLLWMALMFSFIVYKLRIAFVWKLASVLGGFLIVFLIQSVKNEFREDVLEGVNNFGETKTDLFFHLVGDRVDRLGRLFSDEQYMAEMNVRLNQGWIISAVLKNVPALEPFAHGETILDDISATIVPRFLDPDKMTAGGQENFERFTGLPLGTNTSMGISVIGEAYANFGAVGSWAFMFFWGLLLSWGYGRLVKYGDVHPIIHVFIPLIFLQVIKAETELYVVLNHFVKSIILIFIFLWFARKYLKWEV